MALFGAIGFALAAGESADLSATELADPMLAALGGKVESTTDAVDGAKLYNRKMRERIRMLQAGSEKWDDEASRSAKAREQAEAEVERLRGKKKFTAKVRAVHRLQPGPG